jgi:hypothetical protein
MCVEKAEPPDDLLLGPTSRETRGGAGKGDVSACMLYTHVAPPELEPVNSSVMTLKSTALRGRGG